MTFDTYTNERRIKEAEAEAEVETETEWTEEYEDEGEYEDEKEYKVIFEFEDNSELSAEEKRIMLDNLRRLLAMLGKYELEEGEVL